MSLGVKFAAVTKLGLRGVALWQASGMWSDYAATFPTGYSSVWDVSVWCPEHMAQLWAVVRQFVANTTTAAAGTAANDSMMRLVVPVVSV